MACVVGLAATTRGSTHPTSRFYDRLSPRCAACGKDHTEEDSTTLIEAGESHPAQFAGPWLALAPSLAFRPSTGRASCPPLWASA